MITGLNLSIHQCLGKGNVRKTSVLAILFLLGLVGVFSPAPVRAEPVEVMTPKSGTTIISRLPEIHLVLRQPVTEEVSRIKRDNTRPLIKPLVVMEDGDYRYLHFRLPLVPKTNKFTILPGNLPIELNYQPVRGPLNRKPYGKNDYMFHLNDKLPAGCDDCHDLKESDNIDPMGQLKGQPGCFTCHKNSFNKLKFEHSPAVNNQCLVCHQQSIKPWKIGIPKGKIDDTCLTCHTALKQEIASGTHRHGPLVAGCTLCHNPHGDEYKYYLWADGSLDICITCHSDKRNLKDNKDSRFTVHGIISGPGCVVCHDPHVSDQRFMLLKPVNDLCLGCHRENIDLKIGHPVAGHPNSGPVELRRPGRELTCVGCHDPHGSIYEHLLVETKLGGTLCRGCHKNR